MNVVKTLRSRVKSPFVEMSLLSGDKKEEGGASNGALPVDASVSVEPKTYFANERTFIQWISSSLLLLTVSSIMMGSGNYNGTSSVIAFSALILVIYASFVYFRRVNLLQSGTAYGYLDFLGPSILAIGVGLGVAIVFADAVKGSEFMPFGKNENGKYKDNKNKNYKYYDDDDDRRRRFLSTSSSFMAVAPDIDMMPHSALPPLVEVEGTCSRYTIQGINFLEYQPRDIVFLPSHSTMTDAKESSLIVATPQSLVWHPLAAASITTTPALSAILAEFPDVDIQSMTMVGNDRMLALSTGPRKTELLEFHLNEAGMEIASTFLIDESPSATGSLVFVPTTMPAQQEEAEQDGKLYIYLDGNLHTYQLPPNKNSNVKNDDAESSSTPSLLARTGSINMKVMNRGMEEKEFAQHGHGDAIIAMEHFEGLTYILRHDATMEAWDLSRATLVAQMSLPAVPSSNNDKWVGMAFERRFINDDDEEQKSSLRKSKAAFTATEKKTDSAVYLHMPLDTFPPQLWSFRLVEEKHDGTEDNDGRSIFMFPECNPVAMN